MSSATKTFDIIMPRVYDAPVADLWRAWSDGEQVMQWWGPTAFTCPVCKMDFREGGTTLVAMRSPDGFDMYNTWSYTKIEPMERIEFVLHFSDAEGNAFDPASMGFPAGIPMGVRHVISFEPVGNDKSKVTVAEYGYTTQEVVDLSSSGLVETLDKLAAFVAQARRNGA